MRFYQKKRRIPSITIVSLIDILVILLIFFIVTTTFRKKLPQLNISLPESKSAETTSSKEEHTMTLEIGADSKILLNNQVTPLEKLGSQLQVIKKRDPESSLTMKADKSTPFGTMVKVFDALREAGINNIPAITQAPEKNPQE